MDRSGIEIQLETGRIRTGSEVPSRRGSDGALKTPSPIKGPVPLDKPRQTKRLLLSSGVT